FALNVNTNLDHFRLITPCGLHGTGVTSIAQQAGRDIDLDEVREIVTAKFAEVFERDVAPVAESIRLIKIIVHDGDRILLLHRKPERGNFWQPITGSIEDGESPHDTARRELAEETGHRGEPEALDLEQSFMIESHFLETRYPAPIVANETVFSFEMPPGSAIRMDDDEHDQSGWFTFAEAYEKIRWTDDREAMEKVERRLLSCRVAGLLETSPLQLSNPATE
ncbi:MAG: NUDIX domain-containing protein, partial [Thermoanaerobaculia bacterium]